MPAERKDSRWDSADCQTRKLPSCSPFSPSVLGGPPARCKQGQCGGSPAPATDYRESLSFAGRSVVVILGVARPRPIKLQTPRNRNKRPSLPLHPSFLPSFLPSFPQLEPFDNNIRYLAPLLSIRNGRWIHWIPRERDKDNIFIHLQQQPPILLSSGIWHSTKKSSAGYAISAEESNGVQIVAHFVASVVEMDRFRFL